MPSRSFRRTVAALALAAVLLPFSALHAGQRHTRPAPATAATHLSPILGAIVQFFIDAGMMIDGNG